MQTYTKIVEHVSDFIEVALEAGFYEVEFVLDALRGQSEDF